MAQFHIGTPQPISGVGSRPGHPPAAAALPAGQWTVLGMASELEMPIAHSTRSLLNRRWAAPSLEPLYRAFSDSVHMVMPRVLAWHAVRVTAFAVPPLAGEP